MDAQAQICVVGSCNIDQIAYASRLPLPGETIHGHKYEIGFGGKGANQCVAAAKLGAETVMIAKVGDDTNGREYIANLKGLGVDVTHVTITQDACTGVAPIIVADNGINSIVVVSGANMLLAHRDIDNASNILKGAKALLCQLEIDFKTTLYALKMAREAGVVTILNPSPVTPDLDKEIFKYCDVICPNETEASIITGIEVTDVESAKVATRELLNMGCKSCVITLGKDGCVYGNADSHEAFHVKSRKVTAVDTTGAGDAFLGALAYFLCHFNSMEFSQILSRACWVAAESVRSHGTQKSYPLKSNIPPNLFQANSVI